MRYADDFVMGFQYETDARRMAKALDERLTKFGLTLNEAKTRLIEFGKLAAEFRRKRGAPRPETFAFLGFTHYCAWSRAGRFLVKRRTDRRRLTRKLHAVRAKQRHRMHAPLSVQHRWLCSVLRGHYLYYGLPSKLASDERVLPGAASWLVPGASSPEPAAAHLAPLPAVARALPPSVAIHHAPPPGACLMPRLTSGGAECGKAARSDLWGRKPNG